MCNGSNSRSDHIFDVYSFHKFGKMPSRKANQLTSVTMTMCMGNIRSYPMWYFNVVTIDIAIK